MFPFALQFTLFLRWMAREWERTTKWTKEKLSSLWRCKHYEQHTQWHLTCTLYTRNFVMVNANNCQIIRFAKCMLLRDICIDFSVCGILFVWWNELKNEKWKMHTLIQMKCFQTANFDINFIRLEMFWTRFFLRIFLYTHVCFSILRAFRTLRMSRYWFKTIETKMEWNMIENTQKQHTF